MSSQKFTTLTTMAAIVIVALVLLDRPASVAAGGKHGAHGTACIVKGSYCSCHYCKCEKGWVHCGYKHGHGKKYCYGSMEGQYCHCDYCKCKHGFGSKGYGKCH